MNSLSECHAESGNTIPKAKVGNREMVSPFFETLSLAVVHVQFCATHSIVSAISVIIAGVFFLGSPYKILKAIVCFYAIQMPTLHAAWTRTNKSQQDKPMNTKCLVSSTLWRRKVNGVIPFAIDGEYQRTPIIREHPSLPAFLPRHPHAAVVANAIAGPVRNVAILNSFIDSHDLQFSQTVCYG